MACEQLIESVRSKDCDGIILNQIDDPALLSQLQKENIPFVCVDAHLPAASGLPMVLAIGNSFSQDATRYLHQHGHQDIGFVGPETPVEHCANTFRGFTDYLKEAGLSCNEEWVAKVPFSQASTEAAVDKMLELNTLPTALLCNCDAVAIDVIRRLKSKGIRIPQDISVMGVDDLLVSRYLDPALSTMTFDKELLGAKAMELLYQIIQGAEHQNRNAIRTTLVERDSVKKIG